MKTDTSFALLLLLKTDLGILDDSEYKRLLIRILILWEDRSLDHRPKVGKLLARIVNLLSGSIGKQCL